MIEVSDKYLGYPSFSVKKPYLSMNSAILSHKIKEDKKASGFKLSIDRGLHDGGSVVGSASKFFGSSFFSMDMVTWGHPRGVKTYLIRVKARAKMSRNLQNTEKDHIQA